MPRSIAPHVASRGREWPRARPGPAAEGTPSSGTPILVGQFPDSTVLLAIEIAWGADRTAPSSTWLWTDITGDVQYRNRVSIQIGRSDEASKPQPASLKITVDNRSGGYSKGPQSVNYPNVRKNTPIRVRVYRNGTWYQRFFGEVVEFTPTWDVTGRYAMVNITAAGSRRRLQQNTQPVLSALRRYITQAPNVVHYWPLEDGGQSKVANPAIGTLPFPFYKVLNTPTAKTFFDFDQGSQKLVSSDGAVGFQGGAGMFVKANTNTTSSKWGILFAYKCAGKSHDALAGDTNHNINVWINSQNTAYIVIYNTSTVIADKEQVKLQMGPTLAVERSLSPPEFLGDWHWAELWISNRGGITQDYRVSMDDTVALGTRVEVAMASIKDIIIFSDSNGDQPTPSGMAHFTIVNAGVDEYDSGFYKAFLGNKDEYVHTRMARLATENGEVLTIIGTTEVRCGPQTVDTFLKLMDDAADVDGGLLYDGVSEGLIYVTRPSRENIAALITLDASKGDLEDPVAPVDDDQGIVNSFTAQRVNGASAIYTRTDGDLGTIAAGSYDGSVTLNFAADGSQVQDYASWQVHLGTDKGTVYRWPAVTLALHHRPALIDAWLSHTLLSRIDITNIDTVRTQQPHDTVSLVSEGYTEIVDQFLWDVQINTSPYAPWQIGTVTGALDDNPTGIRLYPDSSVVATGVGVAGASMTVQTTGSRWIVDTATSTATAPGTVNTILVSDADAANINIQDHGFLYTAAGVLKQALRILVLSKSSSLGTTTVTFLHDQDVPTATGDILRTFPYADFPMALDIQGIKVTCVGIEGTAQPQTFYLDPSTVKYPIRTGYTVVPDTGVLGQGAT